MLEGTASIGVGDEVFTVGPGTTVVAAPGVEHLVWNPTDEPVHARVGMRPPKRWREFTERLFAGEDPLALMAELPGHVEPGRG